MEKFTVVSNIAGLELWIGEQKLRANYLSKVTDVMLDVSGMNSYLTLSFAEKVDGSNKVKQRWLSTLELKDFSINELVELLEIIVKFSSCERLMIDSFAMGKAVIDTLIPVLNKLDKTHLIEIATKDEVRDTELLKIVEDIEIKMEKLRKIMND